MSSYDTVVLDVDGTLVDSVYQHTMLWVKAFAEVGVYVPAWKLHRAIGMGGDRLVAHVAGDDVEKQHGDRLRELHDKAFDDTIDDIPPLPGAADLLAELRTRGLKVVLASSGIEEQTERLLAIVGEKDKVEDSPTSDDVDASKPAPDLIDAAIARVEGSRAVVIGDAVWDVKAAKEAGVFSIALLSGGFGEGELREAGADLVFETPQDVLDHLDKTPFGD
jgi:phosphoglycolate phosphatase-like HAD superfamily hydrolase